MEISYSIEYSAVCSRGKARKQNQDKIFIQNCDLIKNSAEINLCGTIEFDNNEVLAVFDGMGGEEFGETASQIAVETISIKASESKINLEKVCMAINDEICRYMESEDIFRMGSTAAIVSVDKKLHICNIGDSRIYRISNNEIKQLSVDHTAIIGKYHKRRVLKQHLGIPKKEMVIEPFSDDINYTENDIFLICSDGLTDMLSDEEILEQSVNLKISVLAKKLFDKAVENGGKDDISIITFKVV